MLAYNKQDLTNAFIRKQMKKAAKSETISEAENKQISIAYPVRFYSPNIFIRIGLGIVIITACSALASFADSLIKSISVMPYILLLISVMLFMSLEYFIKKYHHYRSGIDDVLLYAALTFLYGSLTVSQLNTWKYFDLLISLVMTLTGILAVIRYSDRLVTLLAYFSGMYFAGALIFKAGIVPKQALPLLIILICFTVYLSAKRYKLRPAFWHYFNCLFILEIFSLPCIYIAGNYFVASIWWNEQFSSALSTNNWKYFFIAITSLMPIWCLLTGIHMHDLVRLRWSVLMTAASVITFHYYMELISIEAEMIMYGIFLIIAAYILIRRLKSGIQGYTYNPLEDSSGMIELEELFIGGSFSSESKPRESTLKDEQAS